MDSMLEKLCSTSYLRPDEHRVATFLRSIRMTRHHFYKCAINSLEHIEVYTAYLHVMYNYVYDCILLYYEYKPGPLKKISSFDKSSGGWLIASPQEPNNRSQIWYREP